MNIVNGTEAQRAFHRVGVLCLPGGRCVLWQLDLAAGNQRVRSITLKAANKTSIVLAGITVVE